MEDYEKLSLTILLPSPSLKLEVIPGNAYMTVWLRYLPLEEALSLIHNYSIDNIVS